MKGKNLNKIIKPTTISILLVIVVATIVGVEGGVSIPGKFDGFVYGNASKFNPERVMIEAFFDPVCPDSRDAWPPLKRALHYYGNNRVSLVLHPFPLPYHDNAYVTSRALHIVNELNTFATFPLWEYFFKYQEQFYNQRTINMTRSEIVDEVADFVTKLLGDGYYSDVKSGFNDRKTDLKTRYSFKYGCSRGVFGTPMFFVNGFALPNVGSPIDYNGWREIIDPLRSSKKEEANQYFFMK